MESAGAQVGGDRRCGAAAIPVIPFPATARRVLAEFLLGAFHLGVGLVVGAARRTDAGPGTPVRARRVHVV